ncbi:unnamed protein product [Penicillium salamii]|nr:unnamed protein product [Penicillium salamii]
MIIVTGGAGLIGSNLIKELNRRGLTNILVVDDMADDTKFRNLLDCKFSDFMDSAHFREFIKGKLTFHPRVLFHYGTFPSVTATGERDFLDINFTYPKELFNWCKLQHIRFIYASSAAVYGNSSSFREDDGKETPLNTAAYFKLLFDQYVRRNIEPRSPQVAGLRLFDVYGPNEGHKGEKASVPYQFYQTRKEFKVIQLFGDHDGYKGGQQKRDFVHVEDVARLNCWFLDHPEISGIYNVGTGVATSFHKLATQIVSHFGPPEAYLGTVDFPVHLKGHYQNQTCADTTKLRRAGSTLRFRGVEEGVKEYMEWLEDKEVMIKSSPICHIKADSA